MKRKEARRSLQFPTSVVDMEEKSKVMLRETKIDKVSEEMKEDD